MGASAEYREHKGPFEKKLLQKETQGGGDDDLLFLDN